MKKILIATVWLAGVLFCALAAEKTPEFSVKVIPTRAVNIEDQFQKILPERPPFFPKVSRVVCGEPFKVEIVFIGAKIQNNALKLSGKLVMTNPQGKKDEIPLRADIGKITGDTAGAFLFPQSLMAVYEPKDPKGKYIFDVELTDANSGKTAKASAQVEYADKIEPKAGEKALAQLGKYYRNPCPECIVPAFREYLANLPKQKAKEKKMFNPLPQLALFYFALKENPQCLPAFTAMFKSLRDPESAIMAGMLLNFVSRDAAKILTPGQRDILKKQFPQNPFIFEKALMPWQLDVCWAEFFIRGTQAPVMKVVNAMSMVPDSMTFGEYQKIAKPTKEDQRKLTNGLTVMAASWSLVSLVKTHPLIRYYVEAALHRREITDPYAGAMAAKALGMQVKFSGK